MPSNSDTKNLSYRNAGVDIDRADQLVKRVEKMASRTQRPEALSAIGGFAALCALPSGYREPILVSCTDGVGTKLCLAEGQDDFIHLGQDLVAMCVNDLIVSGAEPLQFLDYYACGRIDLARSEALLQGISQACLETGCTLAGGETAEMPGVYPEQGFDLAGFALGVVEKSRIIDGSTIASGDIIIGLASSGLHANGFSLVRKVLERAPAVDSTRLKALMTPTRLYPDLIKRLTKALPIKGIAHITGGGLAENLARILPKHLYAQLDLTRWQRHDLFHWLAAQGPITVDEMLSTFNCGLGMLLVIDAKDRDQLRSQLRALNEPFFEVGRIHSEEGRSQVEIINLEAF